MQHEPQNTFDWRAFADRIVWAGIRAARHDPEEMKHRLMIACEHGHIAAEEMDTLIPALGLAEA